MIAFPKLNLLTMALFLLVLQLSQAQEPPTPDYSCNTCGDCEIKNVGNCCGAYPECVNVNFQPDPEAVTQWCADNGMAGACGFPSIDTCACVAGQCQGKLSTEEGVEICDKEPTTTASGSNEDLDEPEEDTTPTTETDPVNAEEAPTPASSSNEDLDEPDREEGESATAPTPETDLASAETEETTNIDSSAPKARIFSTIVGGFAFAVYPMV